MARVNYRGMSDREQEKMLIALSRTFLRIKSEQEMKNFLRKIFTKSEVVMLIRRLQIASLLMHGTSYWEIRDRLGAGFSTIHTVESWLDETIKSFSDIRHLRDKRRRKKRDNNTPIISFKGPTPEFSPSILRKTEPLFALLELFARSTNFLVVDEEKNKDPKRKK